MTLGRKGAGHMGKHLQLSDNFACLDMLPFTKQERHILGDGNTMGPSARLPVTVEKAKKNAKRERGTPANLHLRAQQIPQNILLFLRWSRPPPHSFNSQWNTGHVSNLMLRCTTTICINITDINTETITGTPL